jgi:hypothetical protein
MSTTSRSPSSSVWASGSSRRDPQSSRSRHRAGAAERLAEAGVKASVRAGRVRLSCHLYNTAQDIDRALEALTGAPAQRSAAWCRPCAGITSVKRNPSRSTVSPIVTGIAALKSGPSTTTVWNSPFSPH